MTSQKLPKLQCSIPCNDAIQSGICKADCCRAVCLTFLQTFYSILSGQRYCEPDEEFLYCELVQVYRSDAICVFLNQDTNRCNIYKLRPQVCSNYGTTHKCFHFDSDGRRLTKKERWRGRRRKEYDTPESLSKGFKMFKDAWADVKKGGKLDHEIVNESEYQQQVYTELKSLAAPVVAIEALRLIRPDMVVDARTVDLLTGGGV